MNGHDHWLDKSPMNLCFERALCRSNSSIIGARECYPGINGFKAAEDTEIWTLRYFAYLTLLLLSNGQSQWLWALKISEPDWYTAPVARCINRTHIELIQ